jgi:hypothetical protein
LSGIKKLKSSYPEGSKISKDQFYEHLKDLYGDKNIFIDRDEDNKNNSESNDILVNE